MEDKLAHKSRWFQLKSSRRRRRRVEGVSHIQYLLLIRADISTITCKSRTYSVTCFNSRDEHTQTKCPRGAARVLSIGPVTMAKTASEMTDEDDVTWMHGNVFIVARREWVNDKIAWWWKDGRSAKSKRKGLLVKAALYKWSRWAHVPVLREEEKCDTMCVREVKERA